MQGLIYHHISETYSSDQASACECVCVWTYSNTCSKLHLSGGTTCFYSPNNQSGHLLDPANCHHLEMQTGMWNLFQIFIFWKVLVEITEEITIYMIIQKLQKKSQHGFYWKKCKILCFMRTSVVFIYFFQKWISHVTRRLTKS